MTDTDIKRAAQQHLQGIEDSLEHDLMDACMPHDEMDDIEEYITDAFAVGAKWGAQRAVEDNALIVSMWNREKLKEAAREWSDSKNPINCDWDAAERTYYSFLAGCEYIIKQIKKDYESKI